MTRSTNTQSRLFPGLIRRWIDTERACKEVYRRWDQTASERRQLQELIDYTVKLPVKRAAIKERKAELDKLARQQRKLESDESRLESDLMFTHDRANVFENAITRACELLRPSSELLTACVEHQSAAAETFRYIRSAAECDSNTSRFAQCEAFSLYLEFTAAITAAMRLLQPDGRKAGSGRAGIPKEDLLAMYENADSDRKETVEKICKRAIREIRKLDRMDGARRTVAVGPTGRLLETPSEQVRAQLVKNVIRRTPKRKWPSLSADHISEKLRGKGYDVSPRTIGREPSYQDLLIATGRTRIRKAKNAKELSLSGDVLEKLVDEQRNAEPSGKTPSRRRSIGLKSGDRLA
jgi:hypothetical protein